MSLSRLIARLIMVPIGLVAAILAVGLFLGFALFSSDPHIAQNPEVQGFFTLFWGVVIASFLGNLTFVPTLGFILIAEIFSWRSLYVYLGFGFVLSLFAFHLPNEQQDALATTLDLQALAAGLVGGFVYWLVAGRGAGIVKRSLENKPQAL